MLGIEAAITVEDQPIGDRYAATMLYESRYLTSWFNIDDLEVQTEYNKLIQNSPDIYSRVASCWEYVKNIPYTQFVRSKANVGGRVFEQDDVWLNAGQAIHVPKLNCMNKSILLANLLRQELSPNQVYVCLNNVKQDGIGGHAICYLRLDRDYILETTSPKIKNPFMVASDIELYDSVLFFNDLEVKRIEGKNLREPFGYCHCVKWLEDYLNEALCDEFI